MSTLIDLRRRIKSVRNSQQITQAMKTVSTAKFKKAQRVVLESRPFWHTYPDLVGHVAGWLGDGNHPLLAKREEKKVECLVITSDKGLCGAFNSNLLERTSSFLEEKAAQAEVRIIVIGKKALHFFKKKDYPIDQAYADRVEKLSPEVLRGIAQFLIELYVLNQTDAVYIIYNEFKSILAPRITITRLLPVSLPAAEKTAGFLPPDWDPEVRAILNSLLPLYVENQVLHSFFESQAAEQAARMMAMENATKNAEDLISDLVLLLNKIRQAGITKELLEIMTAVEELGK